MRCKPALPADGPAPAFVGPMWCLVGVPAAHLEVDLRAAASEMRPCGMGDEALSDLRHFSRGGSDTIDLRHLCSYFVLVTTTVESPDGQRSHHTRLATDAGPLR